ncbi:MAG: ROK family protein [Parcubacteria group bacterium]|nr:ROK family protein [Parcubacteria group bacterium]
MRLALSKDGESFDEPKVVPTPKNFNEAIKAFKEAFDEVAKGESVEKAVGGMRGPFNNKKTIMVNSSMLPDWNDKPLKEEMEKVVGAPVIIENDTALVGMGEMLSGAGKLAPPAGRGTRIGVYITVSTGVGGARYHNGVLDENRFGFEPGHQVIDFKNNISLEDLVSGTALEKREGKKAYEVTDPAIWDELAKTLAYGLYNTILHWSPDVVVLGGSMIVGDPAIEVELIEKYLKEINTKFPELPEIKKAELEDFGGLYGAIAFIKQQKELK